jgi:hypothetical protein
MPCWFTQAKSGWCPYFGLAKLRLVRIPVRKAGKPSRGVSLPVHREGELIDRGCETHVPERAVARKP